MLSSAKRRARTVRDYVIGLVEKSVKTNVGSNPLIPYVKLTLQRHWWVN